MNAPDSSSSETPGNSEPASGPKMIGEFRLIRRLGAGGMSEVHLAEQTSLGRQVALKILRNSAMDDKDAVLLKRFEQEARAAGGLVHPNIVQVYLTGSEGEVHYIVQEYVPGQNLSQWIRRNGPPDYGTGMRWIIQVTEALNAAARAGIVHRDVKPENIMISPDEQAKVTDFGLAQLNVRQEQLNLTQDGTTMGTPWYMSPEQIQGERLDQRSDQYSLGVTCYHMFSGRPPFSGKNAVSVAVQHLKETAARLETVREDLPEEACDVIHRMMEKNPDDRYPTFEELLQVLAPLESMAPRVPGSYTSGRRDWLPAPGILGAGMAVFSVGAFLWAAEFNRPPVLPSGDEVVAFPGESTAVRQYAVALLKEDNIAAWEAVIREFPGTTESEYARMHLGILYSSERYRNENRAREHFQELINMGTLAEERTDLRILGQIGLAYVMRRTDNADDAAQKAADQLHVGLRNFTDDQIGEALQNAPESLQGYYRSAFSN